MFKTIVATASFALLAIASSSSAYAGRMTGSGGMNGLDSYNGMTSANGLGSDNGLISGNGLNSGNGLGAINGKAGSDAEGFQIHAIEIERPFIRR